MNFSDEPCHSVLTKCRVCAKQLVISVADCYNDISDPNKLLPMAACNRCFDLRERRNRTTNLIEKFCKQLFLLVPQKGDKVAQARDKIREGLLKVTMEYAKVHAEYHNAKSALWNEDFTDLFMARPENWVAVMSEYRKQARQHFSQQKFESALA